jgi:nickel-dependent lactate racemase
MKLEFKYDKEIISCDIDKKNFLLSIDANKDDGIKDELEIIKSSLLSPIGSKRLKDIVKKNEKICIVTSDITRPVPTKKILPLLIEEMKKANILNKDITIVLALGSHRKHTEDEKIKIVGRDIYNSEINVIDSDMNECQRLGICKNNTPVDIFKPVLDSDRIICLGNIEYHYFAGYSGGAKAIMPGVSSKEAIQINHSKMIEELSKSGNLLTNPVRQDIDEVGNFLKIDFIVNVILDENKNVIKSFAGNYLSAHREGCRYLDDINSVNISELSDVVIASTGGFPKDINLYQAQKCLENAKHAVKDNGIIILIASLKEGFGSEIFEKWMRTKNPERMIKDIKENFVLGGHKAAAIALVLKKNKIFLVSNMKDETVKSIGFYPFENLQNAVDKAKKIKGENCKISIMKEGSSTLPFKI